MRLSRADAFYLRLWEKSHRAVAAFSGSADSAVARGERVDAVGVDAEPLELRRDAAPTAPLGEAAAHEHVGEPGVVDEAAGQRARQRRLDGLGLETVARETLAQLLAGLLAHEAEALDLAEGGGGVGETGVLGGIGGIGARGLSASIGGTREVA